MAQIRRITGPGRVINTGGRNALKIWRKVIAKLLGCRVVRLTDFDGEINFRFAWQGNGHLLARRMMFTGSIKLFPDGTTSKRYVEGWEEV